MDRQKQILSAALKLFVAYGFHGTPTSKIAEEAGVANGTLFHYYKTKDELVVSLYNDIKAEQAVALSAITHESDFIAPKFRNIFIHTIYWALNNRDKFYYLQQFYLSPHRFKVTAEMMQQHDTVAVTLIGECIRKKLMKQLPPDMAFAMFNSQVFGIYQYLTSASFSPQEQEQVIHDAYGMTWELFKYA